MIKYSLYKKGYTMKKLLISLLLGAAIANAQLVDAVALTVNDDAITLYDIEVRALQTKGDKNAAVSTLVDELLYKQELKKYNITASIFDVNQYLEKLAASNGLDLYAFKSIIKQQYKDYDIFEEETRQRILREKLMQKLVRGNVKIATDEDMELYYENNESQFETAESFEITQYSSKNRQALAQIMKNPMLTFDGGVNKEELSLEQSDLNPQMKYLLNSTAVNSFTPIFTANQNYVTVLIKEKEGSEIESFESAKNKIFGILMEQREQNFLKEYFEKLKLTADIKVIR